MAKGSAAANFGLSPNPATNKVTISLSGLDEEREVSLEVFNQFGQLLLRKEFGVVANLNEQLDLSGFNTGMYFVSLRAGEERYEQKLVISKD